MPSPTFAATHGRMVAVASTVPPFRSGWNAMRVRVVPECELRFCAKSSPCDGFTTGSGTVYPLPLYVHRYRLRCTSPDHGCPGDGANEARYIAEAVVGFCWLATGLVLTGVYAGVVRVVVFFAMSARME